MFLTPLAADWWYPLVEVGTVVLGLSILSPNFAAAAAK